MTSDSSEGCSGETDSEPRVSGGESASGVRFSPYGRRLAEALESGDLGEGNVFTPLQPSSLDEDNAFLPIVEPQFARLEVLATRLERENLELKIRLDNIDRVDKLIYQ